MSELQTLDVFFQIANLNPYKRGRHDYRVMWDEDSEEMEAGLDKEGSDMNIYGTRKEIHKIVRDLERNDISYGEYLEFINNNNKGGQQ